MSKWSFPEELECFNPAGTRFEKTFRDSIALIAYAQYRRSHIVSKRENQWLPTFCKEFSAHIRRERDLNKVKTGEAKVNLSEAISIWMYLWENNPRGVVGDETEEKFKKMLATILPFLNGEMIIEPVCHLPSGKWTVRTRKAEEGDFT